ncbi:hypothetical protein DXG01_016620 [Tephrocybe rancida]|nr:hypothetical protein DXG01_016620 [Tephrocybe rancida]
MCLFMRLLRSNIALLIISHTSFLEALTFFTPPSPIYFGSTVRIAWISESPDPPFFDLYARCQKFPFPKVNASTVQGEIFIALPSGFNLGISASTPSATLPPGPDSTISLSSLITKTGKGSITDTLSTVSTHGIEETSSLSSSTFAKPAASQTASSSTGPLPPHHVNVGAIVGASVGGVSLVVAFFVTSRLWMRRRHSTAPILEPLAYSPEGSSTPANQSSTSRTSGGDTVHENSHNNLLERQAPTRLAERTEERLRRMVEQMSERILALETQQREASPGDGDQQLPPYTDLEAQNNPPHTIEEPGDASSHDPEPQRGLAS